MTQHFPPDSLHDADVADRAFPFAPSGRPLLVIPDNGAAALYCRYSTSGQKESSIERQMELAGEYLARTGRRLVETYIDRARSGGYEVGRDGLLAMMEDASRGKFGIVVIEDVDRLARNLGILSTVYKKLAAMGIEMHQVDRGKLFLTDIAILGLMSDEARRTFAERTQFAREVMARDGRFPTGACFGYRGVSGRPGVIEIDPDQARIVRRIFEMRLAGMSVLQIAFILNAEGVPHHVSPSWNPTGVSIMLRNPRYAGMLVYHRHSTKKDPLTGKRRSLLRPQEDWIIRRLPEIEIIDRDTWERVQQVTSRTGPKPGRKVSRSRDYLLSGLVPCASCGKVLTVNATGKQGPRLSCPDALRRGTCKSRRAFHLGDAERLVVRIVAEEILKPGFVEAYAEGYNLERARCEADHTERRAELRRKVAGLDRKLQASFDEALTSGISNARTAAWRMRIEKELVAAETELAGMPRTPMPVGVDDRRVASLREGVGGFLDPSHPLRDSLEGMVRAVPFRPRDEAGLMLVGAFRDLLERVELTKVGYGEFEAKITVRVGGLIDDGPRHVRTEGFATRVLTGIHRRPARGYEVSPERVAADDRAAAREFTLDDEDWAAVSAVLPPRQRAQSSTRMPEVGTRKVVEAIAFYVVTGASWPHLPASFGSWRHIFFAANKLRRSGTWGRIAAVLMARDPIRWGGLTGRKALRPVWRLPEPDEG